MLLVVAQWFGTSVWFSPSGAADGLMARLDIGVAGFGWLIAATQLGFIAGTFGVAATGAADRFAASRIFAFCCLAGALANAVLVLPGLAYAPAWALRFAVGICLAGIYPLGMKMIVQWVGGKPAAALGWLVGMLVLGTAMPQALRASGATWPWQAILLASSALALVGGAVVLGLGEGPHALPRPVSGSAPTRLDRGGIARLFAVPGFRASAFGYFGHMWELYAFWSVLPWLCRPIAVQLAPATSVTTSVAWLAFVVIGVGALGCIGGGQLARRVGSARVAATALAVSGGLCLLYPLLPSDAVGMRAAALLIWGVAVAADSPQFAALSAGQAPPSQLGSALTVQNGIGFLITVVSILMMSRLLPAWGDRALWLLAPGPILGLFAMRPLLRRTAKGPDASG